MVPRGLLGLGRQDAVLLLRVGAACPQAGAGAGASELHSLGSGSRSRVLRGPGFVTPLDGPG